MSRVSRSLRLLLTVGLATLLFLALAALATGKSVKPKPGKGATAAASQYQYGKTKVTICHKGKTITVGQPAVRAHMRHGDRPGPCP